MHPKELKTRQVFVHQNQSEGRLKDPLEVIFDEFEQEF